MHIGKSVSRVGGAAQVKAIKQVAGSLKLELAQFRALEAFAAFSSDLDKASQKQLARGRRLVEILKQDQNKPQDLAIQIVLIFSATKGYLDVLSEKDVSEYEKQLKEFLETQCFDLLKKIEEQKKNNR